MAVSATCAAWDADDLTASERLVLLVIADRVGSEEGWLFLDVESVASRARVSTQHVHECVDKFVWRGLLEEEPGGGSLYTHRFVAGGA